MKKKKGKKYSFTGSSIIFWSHINRGGRDDKQEKSRSGEVDVRMTQSWWKYRKEAMMRMKRKWAVMKTMTENIACIFWYLHTWKNGYEIWNTNYYLKFCAKQSRGPERTDGIKELEGDRISGTRTSPNGGHDSGRCVTRINHHTCLMLIVDFGASVVRVDRKHAPLMDFLTRWACKHLSHVIHVNVCL